MAKQRQHEPTESEERRARIESRVQELDAKYEKAEKERKLVESKETFDKRKKELAARAADMIASRGKDYFLSQTMLTFLDVAIQMEEAIAMLNDVNTAMACITDAISCMDNILEVNALALDSTLAKKHGFFERRRTRKRIKKTIRNNNGRMREISEVLAGNQQIALSIVNALKKSNRSMQDMMAKNAAKQKKYESKSKSTSSESSQAEKLVDSILSERGEKASRPTASDFDAAPSAPGDKPDAPAASGTDDISDILD